MASDETETGFMEIDSFFRDPEPTNHIEYEIGDQVRIQSKKFVIDTSLVYDNGPHYFHVGGSPDELVWNRKMFNFCDTEATIKDKFDDGSGVVHYMLENNSVDSIGHSWISTMFYPPGLIGLTKDQKKIKDKLTAVSSFNEDLL